MKTISYFRKSPFELTASPETAACWAGRKDVAERLKKLVRVLDNRQDSSLDIIWAKLGAGKSHALYHLGYLLSETGNKDKNLVAFIEMPQQISGFLDLYKSIIEALPLEVIANSVLNSTAKGIPAELRAAARVLSFGGESEKALVGEWLHAANVPIRDLRKCAQISARIETDIRAAEILCGITAALAQKGIRLTVLIDEFQRVAVLKNKARETVLSRLRTIFSKTPACFSVILTIATDIESTALDLVPPELRTLMGHKPPISLPGMSTNDALEFIIDRFNFYRPESYTGGDTHPFPKETVTFAIDAIEKSGNPLIPRELLQVLADISDGTDGFEGKMISATQAKKVIDTIFPINEGHDAHN